MNQRMARRYAHDVILRALDGALEDGEWLAERFSPEELARVLAEVSILRQRHVDAHATLPEKRQVPTVEENCCEHGDHPAPPGLRFCSGACARCELADHDGTMECAGICRRSSEGPRGRAQG